MRVFLAIDIPFNIKKQIVKIEEKLKVYSKIMRLMPVENMHITVKFLGEQNDFSVGKIKEIVKDVCLHRQQFKICLNKSGLFGGIRNPKILWLGAQNEYFSKLSEIVHKKLNIFRMENNKPVCHITIGRIKSMQPKEAVEVLNICDDFVKRSSLCFHISDIYLYESNLLRSGAKYKKMEKFKLKESV